MLLKILLKYLLGYVNIKIEGYFVEKFINKCVNNKIFLWNTKRKKSTIVYTNVGIKDFKRLTKISKATNCKVKILNKKGLPFLLHKYKKRKIFLIIIAVILIILFILSKFIWNIKIEGLDKINQSEISTLLTEKGLKIGKLKSKINKQKIINEIRLERGDIAWIGIAVEGTNATVKIVESDAKPEVINEEDYCNITADKNAQIVKISAQNGIPVVKEGDIVTKGDILIAGWIEGKYTGTRYVHAEGEVQAKVWYTEKERISLNQTVERDTGNSEKKYKIKFNNFTINLYKTLSKFENYDTINENKKLKLLSNFYLPIEIIKKTNYEYKYEEKIYTEEELAKLTEEKIEKDLDEKVSQKENIINKQTNIYPNEDYIEVEVIYEVLENIGSEDKIIF